MVRTTIKYKMIRKNKFFFFFFVFRLFVCLAFTISFLLQFQLERKPRHHENPQRVVVLFWFNNETFVIKPF